MWADLVAAVRNWWRPYVSLWRAIGPRRALVAAIIAAFAGVIWTALVWAPTWLVESDLEDYTKRGLTPSELLGAKNEVRTTLLQGVAGAFLLVGLYLTYRTIQVNREGQITDRFTRAIDQVGSRELDVRLGGIYALERIAKDSKIDHGPVMEVLTAFLREHSRLEPNAEKVDRTSDDAANDGSERLQADLQAAATVIGRRNAQNDPPERTLDLSGLWLPKGELLSANLEGALLMRANLKESFLIGANLRNTALARANLAEAYLNDANLEGALLNVASLQGADLERANLRRADLEHANFERANFKGANLGGAILRGTRLQGAHLSQAIALTREQLAQAVTDQETQLPANLRN
jgi:uncharacterized protein YjbI with pentapeptide repeats